MVHLLRNLMTGDIILLGNDHTYRMGRSRRSEIFIRNRAVDKVHAIITTNGLRVSITDLDSKNGTWVNGVRLTRTVVLKAGDKIKIGSILAIRACTFLFTQANYQVMLDGSLSPESKDLITFSLQSLKIPVVDSFSLDCTHYIAEDITLDSLRNTPVLKFLGHWKYVVTPEFFHDVLKNIDKGHFLPNVYEYIPKIEESLNVTDAKVLPRQNRANIFDKVKFILFEACDYLSDIIWDSGGDTLLFKDNDEFLNGLNESDIRYVAVNTKCKEYQTFAQKFQKDHYEIDIDDIYISVLKFQLQGVLPKEAIKPNTKHLVKNPFALIGKAPNKENQAVSPKSKHLRKNVFGNAFCSATRNAQPSTSKSVPEPLHKTGNSIRITHPMKETIKTDEQDKNKQSSFKRKAEDGNTSGHQSSKKKLKSK